MSTMERAFEEWRQRRGRRQRGDVGLIQLYAVFAAESGRRPEELSAEERRRLARMRSLSPSDSGFAPKPHRGYSSHKVARHLPCPPVSLPRGMTAG